MKIYLINVERAADRRAYMMGELKKYVPDLTIERALCVDIKSKDWTPPKDLGKGRWNSDRWTLTPSNIEVFRSHMDCWQKINISDSPGVVLEDDVLFSKDFSEAVKMLTELRPVGIIRLDGVDKPLLFDRPDRETNGFRMLPLRSNVGSAAAYYVDPHTAGELVAHARLDRHVDDYLFDPMAAQRLATGHYQKIFQIEPIVAIQARFGEFNTPCRHVPEFLNESKRVDQSKERSLQYRGPIGYRLRKDIVRLLNRRRFAKTVAKVVSEGGALKVPALANDLKWL